MIFMCQIISFVLTRLMNSLSYIAAPFVDVASSPLTLLSSIWLRIIRRFPIARMPFSKAIFNMAGVFPIRDHYYEPMFNTAHLYRPPEQDRELPGLALNLAEQLVILSRFHFNDELISFPVKKQAEFSFYYHNGSFEQIDAQYLYNIIRLYKPRRIIEIGSGYSTLMSASAIQKNKDEDTDYACEQTCIEPYENRWLEGLGLIVLRTPVQKVDKDLFRSLDINDILFIDSSHVIRPQGDVVFEYLEILPLLKSGVLVHIHDIFTPKDYPSSWLEGPFVFLNEQYLVEAFLSFNRQYKIIGALHYLYHNYRSELVEKCPLLTQDFCKGREPGSLWIIRT